MGVRVRNSSGVTVDRVRIHDVSTPGLRAYRSDAATSVQLTRSLIERASSTGAVAQYGALLEVEDTVIRDTLPEGGQFGWGLHAITTELDAPLSRVEVRHSVLERNTDAAILVLAGDLVVEDTVIRNTRSNENDQSEGSGIIVSSFLDDTIATAFELRRSTVEHNRACGVCVIDANATVEHATVQGTSFEASDGGRGWGIMLASTMTTEAKRPAALVRQSTVRDCRSVGLATSGVDAAIEGLLVRHIAAEQASGTLGRGVAVEQNPATRQASSATIHGSSIEDSHEVGLLVLGSTATVEGALVRRTQPRPADGTFGRGVVVQLSVANLAGAQLTFRQGLVEDSHEAGLYVAGGDTVLEDSIVRLSQRRSGDQQFGDGIIGAALQTSEGPTATSVRIIRCRVEQNDRAGVATFGASVALGATLLDCNPVPIDGETHEQLDWELSDLGDNVCGCGAEVASCQVSSTDLSPPDALTP